ncbi:SprT family zinc-dependent metalloprotease [Aspergillus melleus]|uniref:SprT family zinc-dependent metalloprotease n=1 Tax=Aspergillus melleus TaxID=138277 RepID=UPI001E8EBAB8|nr:uncharacterized protein LDX57_012645 [Aspergillus melleus]KAH8435016.1 hypothetical protein LDX57_012645 [Aspergillus melleus]
MARLNTTKPKGGDDTRPNKKPVRHLGQRGVLQSKFRDTVHTSDSEDREDTQWRSKSKFSRTTEGQTQRMGRHQRTGTVSSGIFDIFSDADGASDRDDDASRSSSGVNKANKDGALDLARVNSLLRRPSQQSRHRTSRKSELYNYDKENDPVEVELAEEDSNTPSTISRNPSDASTRRSPVRNARQTPARNSNNRLFSQYRQPERRSEDDDNEDNDSDSLDEFIVSDNEEPSYHETSDNETAEERVQEVPSYKPKRKLMRGRRPNPEAELLKALQHTDDLRLEPSLPAAITLPPSPERKSEWKLERQSQREGEELEELSQNDVNFSEKMHHLSLEDNDPSAQLQQELFGFVEDSGAFSSTPEPEVISLSPPRTATKNLLRSPRKGKNFIPPTPYRESVDALWDPEVTNDWFDKPSPHKKVDRLLQEFEESDNEIDPDSMLRRRGAIKVVPKTPSKTALKKAETEQKKAAIARRRSFDNKKADVAEEFFKTLDDVVTGGKIQQMAAETGGVRITWNKTLQTTAGRASWRRERSMSPPREGQSVASQKQFAGIELAARIIDNEDRLINTLAHEYCHLANYMISHVTNNPHGTSFKLWGQKCKEALKDHPVYGGRVEVTTKHSYKIDYKYVWCCVDCGQSYGRHSKSIDPAKSTCGKCKGLLQQIKPKPRNVSPKKQPAPQSGMGFSRAPVDNVTMVLQEVNVLH